MPSFGKSTPDGDGMTPTLEVRAFGRCDAFKLDCVPLVLTHPTAQSFGDRACIRRDGRDGRSLWSVLADGLLEHAHSSLHHFKGILG
jgi:hypothetical protein